MGLPMRSTADWLIDFARAHGMLDPNTKNVTQTLARASADLPGKNYLRYGVFGGMTGMDVSPTFAAADLIPMPDVNTGGIGDVAKKLFPIPAKIGEMAGNAANLAIKGTGKLFGGQGPTHQDIGAAAKSLTPPAFQGLEEAAMQEKNGQIANPNRHMEGNVKRGPPSLSDHDWLARFLGTRSVKESEQSTGAYQAHLQEQAINARKTNLVGNIIDMRDSKQNANGPMNEYFKLGGTPQTLVQDIQKHEIARGQTALEQQKGIPKNVQGIQKYLRGGEYK